MTGKKELAQAALRSLKPAKKILISVVGRVVPRPEVEYFFKIPMDLVPKEFLIKFDYAYERSFVVVPGQLDGGEAALVDNLPFSEILGDHYLYINQELSEIPFTYKWEGTEKSLEFSLRVIRWLPDPRLNFPNQALCRADCIRPDGSKVGDVLVPSYKRRRNK